MKIYIDDKNVCEVKEDGIIRFEMEDGSDCEMEIESFKWLLTEALLPTE